MRKSSLFILFGLLLAIGFILFLSFQAREVPMRTIETEVRPSGESR